MLQNGETALHLAALEGDFEVVHVLVKYGAAVDIRNKVSHSIDRHHKNISSCRIKFETSMGGGDGKVQ